MIEIGHRSHPRGSRCRCSNDVELGSQVLTAAVGDMVARTMSAAVGRFEARASVDDQLERLRTMSIMLHSAVEAAEDVHIRSWWLRRWLWTLRDAALDADELLRLFRRRRAAEEAATAGRQQAGGSSGTTRNRNTLWGAAWHALQSAKNLLFGGRNDDDIERLKRTVARMENEAMGLGDFLKTLQLEIRRSQPLVQPDFGPPIILGRVVSDSESDGVEVHEESMVDECQSDKGVVEHDLSYISHDVYVAGVRKMGLLVVRQRVRQALDKLIKKPAVAPPPPAAASCPLDIATLCDMVFRIDLAIESVEFPDGERCWLALWLAELQAVVDRAKRVLLAAVPVSDAGGDGADVVTTPAGDGEDYDGLMRSTALILETAVAHLEDFSMLAWFAETKPHRRPRPGN